MHNCLYFTFNRDKAKNSLEAREWAITELEDEGFFDQKRFSSGRGDWGVIGGRWSGDLTLKQLDQTKVKQLLEQTNKVKGKNEKERDTKREELFYEAFPDFPKQYKGKIVPIPCPLTRGTYEHHGYDDDAMIITTELYNAIFKKDREGKDSDDDDFIDYEFDVCTKDFIGNKWVVVVDWHC